jgi:MFS family permease
MFAAASVPGLPSALRHRDFRLLFSAQAISVVGDGMAVVALAFAVLDLTGRTTDLGIVLAARMVPMLALLLAAGVLADRRSRRAVMLGADVFRAASQGLSAALLVTGHAEVWQLALLQAVHGGASAVFMPASTGLVPALVPSRDLQQANALRGIAQSVGMLAGPAIGGVLVAAVGSGWAIAGDAATYALSAAFLVRLRIPQSGRPPAARPFLADLREGWREFRARTWVWAGVSAASATNMLLAGYLVLGPALARADLGGPGAWALISSAFGGGMLLGGLGGMRVRPRHPLRAFAVLLCLPAAPSLALAGGASAVGAAALALPAGLGLVLLNAIWETTLQQHVPAHALSRVSAYDWLGSLAFEPVGYVLAGVVASMVGLRPALLAVGLLSVASGAALLAVQDVRSMRRLELHP